MCCGLVPESGCREKPSGLLGVSLNLGREGPLAQSRGSESGWFPVGMSLALGWEDCRVGSKKPAPQPLGTDPVPPLPPPSALRLRLNTCSLHLFVKSRRCHPFELLWVQGPREASEGVTSLHDVISHRPLQPLVGSLLVSVCSEQPDGRESRAAWWRICLKHIKMKVVG